MYDTTNPSTELLESAPFYIYSITGPGGRIYFGLHKHTKGEPWTDYTGSGLRLRDEQAYLEPHAFLNPQARTGDLNALKRKPGTVLRHYTKRYVIGASSYEDAKAKETVHIGALVLSGATTYNIDEARDFALTYEQRKEVLAYELSFESAAKLKGMEDAMRSVVANFPTIGHGGFRLPLAAIKKARRYRDAREKFRKSIGR